MPQLFTAEAPLIKPVPLNDDTTPKDVWNLRQHLNNLKHWRRAQPAANAIAICPEERRAKRDGNPLSRWLTSPPEDALRFPNELHSL
ncbi:hypothetical protein DSLASN_34330 [Desulfoluna limicola]|uniref:Uncharacterized protein n=1 Tax=Desulfoluna limicola TaxID=2810562 RepID=A0ABM7PL29_9BACT|nr:hypothetical protein DSLASN_34330 [Desulfoluna limicola]